jgi:acyl dehydratase
MRTLSTLDEITAAVGDELGSGEWLTIEQDRVQTFADATGDHQWIHVDIERANAGPFGGPIAHGYLTLSLIPFLGSTAFALETPGARLNYGLNKVRFPHPVKVGQRVRDTVTLLAADRVGAGVQVTMKHVIEIEGEAKPACVAEMLVLLLDG